MAAAERALALDPNSLFGLVYKGRVLMQRAIAAGDRSLAEQARAAFLKANRVNPNHALPLQLFYDSFAPMGDAPTDGAVNGLYASTILVPQDPSLRIRAAIELLRQDDVDRAQQVLAPAAFAAESVGENPPLQLIKEMRTTRDPEALLAKAAEFKLDKINEFIPPEDDEEDAKD